MSGSDDGGSQFRVAIEEAIHSMNAWATTRAIPSDVTVGREVEKSASRASQSLAKAYRISRAVDSTSSPKAQARVAITEHLHNAFLTQHAAAEHGDESAIKAVRSAADHATLSADEWR